MNYRRWSRFACSAAFSAAYTAALAVACAGLGGCTRKYYFEGMDARYQSPDLPTQFATNGKRGFRFSGAFDISGEGRYMDISRQDTLWPMLGQAERNQAYFSRPHNDTAALAHPVILQEDHRFDRQPILASANLAYIRAHWFWGIATGIGAPEWRCSYLGAYAGYSQLLWGNRIAPTVGGGVFVNQVRVSGRYWSHTESILTPSDDQLSPNWTPDPPTFGKDSVRATRNGLAFPVKMGLLYRWSKAVQPYTLFHFDSFNLWPDETEDTDRYDVQDAGFALGVRNESIPGMEFSLELDYLETGGPMDNFNFGPMVTVRAERRI